MLSKRYSLSSFCGLNCHVGCKLNYFRRKNFKLLVKLFIVTFLTFMIFAPTLHMVYNDIRFSIRYRRGREPRERTLQITDHLQSMLDIDNDFINTFINETNEYERLHFNSSTETFYSTTDDNDDIPNTTIKPNLPMCPENPPALRGKIPVIYPHRVVHIAKNISKLMLEISQANPDVQIGGFWKPRYCVPRRRVAVIIPYRNRSEHLALLLQQLHLVLKRQLLNYHIFVAEQESPEIFNKAYLMNVAYDNISKDYNFDCFVFHDVDLLMENDKNILACDNSPMHLSPAVDTLKYRLPYHELIGGVLAIRSKHFERVNGYSNLYWGWGGEDDDLYYRLENENVTVHRPSIKIGKYKMLRHLRRMAIKDKKRFKLVWSAKERYLNDGLNQLPFLNHSVVSIEKHKLFTHLLIDLGNEPKDR